MEPSTFNGRSEGVPAAATSKLRAYRVAARGCIATALLSALGVACTPTTDLGHVRGYSRVAKTQGSAVAVTQDEQIAVVTNRNDGVVSILHLNPARDLGDLVSSAPHIDIPFHPLNEAKPWAAVIGADDDTAYVLVRGLSEVAKISGLHGSSPRVTETMAVGSEPTGLVISPSGKALYVANWGEGTVTSILVEPWLEATWDLNSRLADEGLVGPLIGDGTPTSAIWTKAQLELGRRPGLAHPRALAVTDDGDADDTDETLYATEFFAQPLAKGGPAGPDDLDHSREGLVYPIRLETGAAPPDTNVIRLAPADVSFKDSEGNATGCYPNQLYSAATSGNRLYISSVCASPSGPVEKGPTGDAENDNFKTLLHSALFVVDTQTNQELPAERVVLTEALRDSYAADAASGGNLPAAAQRMPLLPTEITVAAPDAAGSRQAFISAMGSSAVYALAISANGSVSVGVTGRRFIDLQTGAMPIGLALLSGGRGLVLDDSTSPRLVVLDLATSSVAAFESTLARDWTTDPDTSPAEVLSVDARMGRRLFSTGLTVWSFQGQAWSSCESCHPEGLSDGVTWRFARGPRRTISLAGTYFRDEPTRRMLLWGANIDEVHDVEAIARSLSGGVGGVLWEPYPQTPGLDCRLLYDGNLRKPTQDSTDCPAPLPTTFRDNGLNGSLSALARTDRAQPSCERTDPTCDIIGPLDWGRIDAFVRSVRAPRAPKSLEPQRVSRGASLFKQLKCNGCHAGSGWTLSHVFYEPGPAANGKVPFADPRNPAAGTPPPPSTTLPDQSQLDEMLGLLRTQQYVVPPVFRGASAVASLPFRTAPEPQSPSASFTATQLDYVFGQLPAAGTPAPAPLPPDQINCALRSVGTFAAAPDTLLGVTVGGDAPPVREVRRVLTQNVYGDKKAFGENGFNIPSLVGLAAGAPYFHAGNARSLEESFDPAFAGHYAALVAHTPTADEIRDLVSYLLSIDETNNSSPLPKAELDFDPDLCAQFSAH